MAAEVDIARRRLAERLAELDFLACDIPGCVHPNCRGKTVDQRRAEGKIVELGK